MILGIKLTYIDTELIHHMAITVLNIKESRSGIHYLTILNVSN